MKELLTPDSKTRIKVKEIFSHPWVLSYEKDYRKHKITKEGSKGIRGSFQFFYIGLDLCLNYYDNNKSQSRFIEEDQDSNKFIEKNNFLHHLDKSKLVDFNQSFESSRKINNDLKKLNYIINDNAQFINIDTNITKNTINNISNSNNIIEKESPQNLSIGLDLSKNFNMLKDKLDEKSINSKINKNDSNVEPIVDKTVKQVKSNKKEIESKILN